MIRALLYRGRHHVDTAPRPADGELVTVSTIAARLRREAREYAYGTPWLRVAPGFEAFNAALRHGLDELAPMFSALAAKDTR